MQNVKIVIQIIKFFKFSLFRFLLTQGAAPDWNLTYWAWDKGRVVAQTKTTNSRGWRNLKLWSKIDARKIKSSQKSTLAPRNQCPKTLNSSMLKCLQFLPHFFFQNLLGSRIHEVSMNPQDSSLVCVIGDEIFKLDKIKKSQNKFKIGLKNENSITKSSIRLYKSLNFVILLFFIF